MKETCSTFWGTGQNVRVEDSHGIAHVVNLRVAHDCKKPADHIAQRDNGIHECVCGDETP